jgi:hypothetical protein
MIQNICHMDGIPSAAKNAAVKANGSAKTECENLIMLR